MRSRDIVTCLQARVDLRDAREVELAGDRDDQVPVAQLVDDCERAGRADGWSDTTR
jgi:hypothetical protein